VCHFAKGLAQAATAQKKTFEVPAETVMMTMAVRCSSRLCSFQNRFVDSAPIERIVTMSPSSFATAILAIAASLFSTARCFAQGTMYACESNRSFYSINMATGAKTFIGTISTSVQVSGALAYDCLTQTTYVSSTSANFGVSKQVYRLNVATAVATAIGPYGDPEIIMHGLEIDSTNGNMYGLSSHNGGLYRVDKSTGAATLIGLTGITGLGSFGNLGYDSDGHTMYASNSLTDSLYKIDLVTAQATLIGPLNGPINIGGLAYNVDQHVMYMTDNDRDILYTINVSTGAATPVGSTGPGNLIGLVYVTPTCPSPCTSDIAPPGGDATVNIDDLLRVINSWGPCPTGSACTADIAPPGGNGTVNIDDLLFIINTWGPCH
jgi:hypothetical protein